MLVTRLSLRNFRVFSELDLELPPGVVGIYGPNGSGKSTLVEAIAWALFGVARTAKDSLRRDGAEGECRATVEFEHDGHRYEISRSLAGADRAVRVVAACDGLELASGVQAVRQYVHHILGMSAEAFRASVFCEQNQLDAFSGRRPEERRRVVLDLLGITPLDRARDAARTRARTAREALETARLVLGDVDALAAQAAELEAELERAAQLRERAEAELAAAQRADALAETDAGAAERRKFERDRLAAAWTEARSRCADISERLSAAEEDQALLAEAAGRLPALEEAAADLEPVAGRLAALEALEAAQARLARAEAEAARSDGLAPVDVQALEEEAAAAARAAGEATGRLAGTETARAAAAERWAGAAHDVEAATRLDPDAPCPLCGQELGDCFESVRASRQRALDDARDRLARAEADRQAAGAEAAGADERAATAGARLRTARRHEGARAAAQAEVDAAHRLVREARAALEPAPAPGEAAELRARLASAGAARDEALRLRERLARAGRLEAAVTQERARLTEARALVARLAEEGRALAFDADAHRAALAARRTAREQLASAQGALTEARMAEVGLAERLAGCRARLDDELARRRELTEREDEARHLGRLAELLAEFRNHLVGQVGPALSAQTSALFRELTDGRFDRLDVDADTFELRLGAAGAGHPLDRHSGSETDLANLCLRVAVGEQVNLLSGGQVGLLVLDEVLGSLDAEHRHRLLGTLGRLGARFRQVLVVTHAPEVKEQLPGAIEVVPLARGRSRIRLPAEGFALAAAG